MIAELLSFHKISGFVYELKVGQWKDGQEMKTLAKLYQHCLQPENINDKVMFDVR